MAKSQDLNANNAFIKLRESANGRVSVKLQKNQFAKEGAENFYGKVERHAYSAQNVLDAMAESIPLVDAGTIASVLNAYANAILKALAAGNAVKFGELGTFYIAGKGTFQRAAKLARRVSTRVRFANSPYQRVRFRARKQHCANLTICLCRFLRDGRKRKRKARAHCQVFRGSGAQGRRAER